MDSIKKTVGENLRQVCKVKKIKNKEIAEYMGVSETSVSNWFRGKNSFDIDNLYSLCCYLDISLDQAFGVDPIVFGVLNEEENNVLVAYRKAGEETKNAIRKILDIPSPEKDTLSKAE